MEALRTVKEAAEQPEREAKERHLKAWEGEWKCDIISPSSVSWCVTLQMNEIAWFVFASFWTK